MAWFWKRKPKKPERDVFVVTVGLGEPLQKMFNAMSKHQWEIKHCGSISEAVQTAMTREPITILFDPTFIRETDLRIALDSNGATKGTDIHALAGGPKFPGDFFDRFQGPGGTAAAVITPLDRP